MCAVFPAYCPRSAPFLTSGHRGPCSSPRGYRLTDSTCLPGITGGRPRTVRSRVVKTCSVAPYGHNGVWDNLPHKAPDKLMESFTHFTEECARWFPALLAVSGVVGTVKPASFAWMNTQCFTGALVALSFSMGITLTFNDLKNCLAKPMPVLVNFAACYTLMPLLGLALGHAFGFPPSFIAGLVLVGATNGGQSSNLCTYIARGDVALSVIMTTTTTLGCVLMTPLICKLAIGALVPMNVYGMAVSTLQVVLLPIISGIMLNELAPNFCRCLEPLCVLGGLCATSALVGGSLSQCADSVLAAGWRLHAAAVLLHVLGGVIGYFGCKILGFSEKINRTTAIETSMKSAAWGYLLAALHFGSYAVRVPAAVSTVWVALVGSCIAVFWQQRPVTDGSD